MGEPVYLGDSISVRENEHGEVALLREYEDGYKTAIYLEPLVLDEFLNWLEDEGWIEPVTGKRLQRALREEVPNG